MSKNKKTSLYKAEPILRLEQSMKTSDTLSGKINKTVDRYQHIIRSDMPELTDNEINIIGNCLSGTFIDPLTVEYLDQDIGDYDDLANENINYPELVEKIKKMTIGQRYAVLEKLGM